MFCAAIFKRFCAILQLKDVRYESILHYVATVLLSSVYLPNIVLLSILLFTHR